MHIAAQPADIRSCDKFGIVAVQPAGDKESDVSGRQWNQRLEVMRDVIIYFRNSPSIIFWEAGNAEISLQHMRQMVDLRKELDPHGMRFMGCRSLQDLTTISAAEWVGTMLGRRVRDGGGYTSHGLRIRNAALLIETEYARDEAPRRVWDDYSPPDFDYRNVFTGSTGQKETARMPGIIRLKTLSWPPSPVTTNSSPAGCRQTARSHTIPGQRPCAGPTPANTAASRLRKMPG